MKNYRKQLPPRPCHPEAVAESEYAREMMIIAGAPTLSPAVHELPLPGSTSLSRASFRVAASFSKVMFACPTSTYFDTS